MIPITEERVTESYGPIEKLEKIQHALLRIISQLRGNSGYDFPELERAVGSIDSAIQKLESQ